MNNWNPFGKIDMEIGSFLKNSVFNKEYGSDTTDPDDKSEDAADKDERKQ